MGDRKNIINLDPSRSVCASIIDFCKVQRKEKQIMVSKKNLKRTFIGIGVVNWIRGGLSLASTQKSSLVVTAAESIGLMDSERWPLNKRGGLIGLGYSSCYVIHCSKYLDWKPIDY